jgi:pimeloyl-ACP methyl ester carboxylesterase
MQPRLIPVSQPSRPEGVVLVLHGGAARQARMAVSPTQLSVLRMIPVAKRIARAGGGGLAVYRLLNSYRGWDTEHTPVHDVGWALDQIGERYSTLPVCLVGHSLGGRAALLAGDRDPVRSVVALNPWVYPTDDNDLSDRQVLFVHGTDDRVAIPERAELVATRMAARGTVGFITVPGGKHAMLRQGSVFETAAAQWASATLLGQDVPAPVGRVLAGEAWLTA